jgi:hypothetical protein
MDAIDSIDYFSFSTPPLRPRFLANNLSSLWKREGGRDFWRPFSNHFPALGILGTSFKLSRIKICPPNLSEEWVNSKTRRQMK